MKIKRYIYVHRIRLYDIKSILQNDSRVVLKNMIWEQRNNSWVGDKPHFQKYLPSSCESRIRCHMTSYWANGKKQLHFTIFSFVSYWLCISTSISHSLLSFAGSNVIRNVFLPTIVITQQLINRNYSTIQPLDRQVYFMKGFSTKWWSLFQTIMVIILVVMHRLYLSKRSIVLPCLSSNYRNYYPVFSIVFGQVHAFPCITI